MTNVPSCKSFFLKDQKDRFYSSTNKTYKKEICSKQISAHFSCSLPYRCYLPNHPAKTQIAKLATITTTFAILAIKGFTKTGAFAIGIVLMRIA